MRQTKILIVDDEVLTAFFLEQAFQEEGYETFSASSAEEALQVGSLKAPNVLLCDWILKDRIDGIDVARQLMLDNPSLQTIIMSGFLAEAQERAKEKGLPLFHLVPKPCSFESLKELVEHALVHQSIQTRQEEALP